MELVRGETFADIFLDRVSERSPNRPLHPTVTASRRPRVSARSLGSRRSSVRRVLVYAALICLAPVAVSAVSAVYDVTPSNLGTFSVSFAVTQDIAADGLLEFTISIDPSSGGVSDACEGRFLLYRESVKPRPGATLQDHATRPPAEVECKLKYEACGKLLCYRLRVASEALDRATFRYVKPDLETPAIDNYEVILGEFVKQR
jgi:hypothetical protein